MIAIFIYGFGVVYLMSGLLGYNLSFVQVFGIGFIAYLCVQTLFKNKKTIFITLATLTGISAILVMVLNFTNYLPQVLEQVRIFGLPYLEALRGGSVDLGLPRQAMVIGLFGIALYKLIRTYNEQKYAYPIFFIGTLVLVTLGFLNSRLSHSSDRLPLLVLFITQFVFYFYYYYTNHIKNDPSLEGKYGFLPFFPVIGYYTAVIIFIAFSLFQINPFPFYRQPISSSIGNQESEELYERYQQLVDITGNISDEFIFRGVELMRVKREHSRYLKGFVYENFNGEWEQSDETLSLPQLSLEDYGVFEPVEILYTRLISPVYYTAGYETLDMETTEEIYLDHDLERNTYKIINYDYRLQDIDIAYTYNALHLDMQDDKLIGLLRSSNNTMNLEGTIYELPEDYSYVKSIAAGIVDTDMTDYDKTIAILSYLKNNYVYNVKPILPINNEADRIEFFLLTSKEGFCQHFSTAAALMLRAEGIPTRYVTGYLVNEQVDYNNIQYDQNLAAALAAGKVQVKDSDAHTWIEVYFNGVGWISFETTGIADSVEVRTEVEDRAIATEVEVIDNRLSPEVLLIIQRIVLILLAIGFVVVICRLTIYIIRRKRIYRQGSNTVQVGIVFDLINDYLDTLACEKYNYETYREYAKRIDEYHFSDVQLAHMITDYEGIIYGGYEAESALKESYLQFLADVKVKARTHGKLYRVLNVNLKEKISL